MGQTKENIMNRSYGQTKVFDVIRDGTQIRQGVYELEFGMGVDKTVISWNIETAPQDSIEISFAVRSGQRWSEPYRLARWSSCGRRYSYEYQSSDFGRLATDEFISAPDKSVSSIRIEIDSLNGQFPEINGLYVSILKNSDADPKSDNKIGRRLPIFAPAPVMVQYPVKDIGRVICSPTSCAMTVASYGVAADPEAMANAVYDEGAKIYGNWSFNMAAVAQLGFRAYVRHFGSVHELIDEVASGRPVPVSVKTPKDLGFDGALQTYPSGHLLLVVGFAHRKGEPVVIVHDPADDDEAGAVRFYSLEDFMKYWVGIGYIINPRVGKLADEGPFRMERIKRWIPGVRLELKYATADNFTGQILYDGPESDYALLERRAVKKLTSASYLLAIEGYDMKIWDAFRPGRIQEKLWDIVQDERYVAHPQKGSKHSSGCAVDLTITTRDGQELVMPSGFDDFSERAASAATGCSQEAMANLSVLQTAMRAAGFSEIPDEWWHFEDKIEE